MSKNKIKNKEIVDKMLKAFDDFSCQMKKLEKQANNLVKKHIQKIDQKELSQALQDIK